ncbi:MAG: hypothetical protein HYZ28_02940 [Myxococcales bacterium]|nr:hypothetical protein [Myxococcales bacterium]
MALPEHLKDAAARLEEAAARIDAAREGPPSLEGMREWLDALTDFAVALSEVHRYTNESVHEKLHELAAHVRLPTFRGVAPHE